MRCSISALYFIPLNALIFVVELAVLIPVVAVVVFLLLLMKKEFVDFDFVVAVVVVDLQPKEPKHLDFLL